MNNTITLTNGQMEALAKGQSITIEPSKPAITKWEPKGGVYYIDELNNRVYEDKNHNISNNTGLVYQDMEKAYNNAKALRSYARQLAWLAENDDGYEFEILENLHNYYIYYDVNNKFYCKTCSTVNKLVNTIYMSEQNANKLCELLNNGIVEF